MDQATHRRYLDYRDTYAYFGRKQKMLSMAEFEAAEIELRDLTAQGADRDDEDEERFEELLKILFKD